MARAIKWEEVRAGVQLPLVDYVGRVGHIVFFTLAQLVDESAWQMTSCVIRPTKISKKVYRDIDHAKREAQETLDKFEGYLRG